MNIFILTTEPFPIGMAAANRIISYSKGLLKLGCSVKVLCLRPADKEPNVFNREPIGIYNNICFEYPAGKTIWPKSKIEKLRVSLYGIFNSVRILLANNNTRKIDVIFSTYDKILFNAFYYLLSRLLRVKFVQVLDEYPYMLRYPEKYNRFQSYFHLKYNYKLCDGMIVMTYALHDYYKDKLKNGTEITIIPMTVEPERFISAESNTAKDKYIAYCGGEGIIDGIDILIKAFKHISNKFSNHKLYIIGGNNSEYIELSKSLNIQDRVVFTGKVQRDEVPGLLKNAEVLALSRPDNVAGRGGFPTKLGEYLATGNPVVVTDVGEISMYLKDRENAFIAKPGDSKDFAKKLEEALQDPKNSRKIGLEGQRLALSVFNADKQANRILEYLNML